MPAGQASRTTGNRSRGWLATHPSFLRSLPALRVPTTSRSMSSRSQKEERACLASPCSGGIGARRGGTWAGARGRGRARPAQEGAAAIALQRKVCMCQPMPAGAQRIQKQALQGTCSTTLSMTLYPASSAAPNSMLRGGARPVRPESARVQPPGLPARGTGKQRMRRWRAPALPLLSWPRRLNAVRACCPASRRSPTRPAAASAPASSSWSPSSPALGRYR